MSLRSTGDQMDFEAERSFEVEHSREIGGFLHWKLFCRGNGHWCRGAGFSRHPTREAAEAEGQAWIALGLDTGSLLNLMKASAWAVGEFARAVGRLSRDSQRQERRAA